MGASDLPRQSTASRVSNSTMQDMIRRAQRSRSAAMAAEAAERDERLSRASDEIDERLQTPKKKVKRRVTPTAHQLTHIQRQRIIERKESQIRRAKESMKEPRASNG